MKKNNTNVKKKNTVSNGKKMAVGVGIAALGAGAYYFLGPNSKKNKKKASILMAQMRKEMVQKVTKAKSFTKPFYHKAVDTLATTYSQQYKIHEKDIKAFAKKLKSEWKKGIK